MSERVVRAKLGRPARVAVRGGGQFRCLLYKHVAMESREEGKVLRNTYVFKQDRLIEMQVHLDRVPGCGQDSRSDRGWPWSVF